MFAEERHELINSILNEEGSIKVTELSEQLKVSEATIRRDLQEMEEKKLLRRTHGGAIKMENNNFEPAFVDKENTNHEDKVKIAKYAAKLINDGDTIILDSGTTTLEIARNLTAKNVTVITNSIDIAAELTNKEDIELIVTGGILRTSTRAMVGSIAVNIFEKFKVNKLFLGANGISVEDGITTPNYTEALTKTSMISSAKKIFIVADSSKFENTCFSKICDIDKVTSIITSGEVYEDIIEKLKIAGVKVVVV